MNMWTDVLGLVIYACQGERYKCDSVLCGWNLEMIYVCSQCDVIGCQSACYR